MTVPLQTVRLAQFEDADRAAFVREELANYAAEQVRESGWSAEEAPHRARSELGPVLERELSEAAGRGHRLWASLDHLGQPVGWLWVTPTGGEPGRAAFLHQITVIESRRRQGYGRAMLQALEAVLARDGFEELRLNVMAANRPARRLYAAAGYELVDRDRRRCRLRKRLRPPS